MRGRMACRLIFNGDEISGGGEDTGGLFVMDGVYDPASQDVVITKTYPAKLRVIYRGRWDGVMIAGRSSIYGIKGTHSEGFYDAGSFELWPEDEEVALEKMTETEDQREPMPVGG